MQTGAPQLLLKLNNLFFGHVTIYMDINQVRNCQLQWDPKLLTFA